MTNNYIPAFGGITSSIPLSGNQDLPNLKVIHFFLQLHF